MKNTILTAIFSITLTLTFMTLMSDAPHVCPDKSVSYERIMLRGLEERVQKYEEATIALEYHTQQFVKHFK